MCTLDNGNTLLDVWNEDCFSVVPPTFELHCKSHAASRSEAQRCFFIITGIVRKILCNARVFP